MTTMQVMAPPNHPTVQQRLLLHGAWIMTAAVFFSVGWMVVHPWDPRGPVSLLAHDQPARMMLAVLALAAVTAAVATVLAGRFYPDVGAFAVGLGLTAVSLRGQTMTYLLIQNEGRTNFGVSLALESLFWLAAMIVAMVCSAVVLRWLRNADHDGQAGPASMVSGEPELLSQMAVAGAGGLIFRRGAGGRTGEDWATGLKHVALVVVISLILIRVFSFSASEPHRAVRHGQACFAVAMGLYLAVGRAQAGFPVHSMFWSCCAVPLVGLAAYGLGWMMSMRAPEGMPASVPASSFLRILPVTYIALGTSATLLARWRSGDHRVAGGAS
ncbi:MAG: hypothetical protein V3W34_00150 [Phycisphaerae bacterium]